VMGRTSEGWVFHCPEVELNCRSERGWLRSFSDRILQRRLNGCPLRRILRGFSKKLGQISDDGCG
jgi:hypothetical protein